MYRPRVSAAVIGLATVIVVGPLFSTVTLAADPTVVVAPGDTLTGISKRHGVAIARLVKLNDLANPNRIFVGQRLRLAGSAGAPARPAAQPSAVRMHTVRPGEHLIGIARRYGVSVAAIASANAIRDASRIFAGQALRIPGQRAATPPPAATPTASPPSQVRKHTVRAGEHLTGIARRYGVTVAAIASANGIRDASRIYVGQQLRVPGRSSSAGASAPAPGMSASMTRLVRERDAVRRIIRVEARRQGVPEAFALAVAWQESGWQQGVVSHAGAIGVMQLMPDTARWIGDAMLGRPVNPRDVRANVVAGVRLLRHYLDRYDGNRDLVLAAYYQGQGAVDRHGIYAVSRPYIASIRVLTSLFGG